MAERIAEYEALGIDTFILSGYPNLEEAVHADVYLLPLVSSSRRARAPLSAASAPCASRCSRRAEPRP